MSINANAFPNNVIRTFNKHVTNRILGLIAGKTRTPFVMVRHVGRKSGKTYQTPIIALRRADGFAIALTYGSGVDWYKNVIAAGQCEIVWHRKTFRIERIEAMDAEAGLAEFGFPFRPILQLRGVKDFVRMMDAA